MEETLDGAEKEQHQDVIQTVFFQSLYSKLENSIMISWSHLGKINITYFSEIVLQKNLIDKSIT